MSSKQMQPIDELKEKQKQRTAAYRGTLDLLIAAGNYQAVADRVNPLLGTQFDAELVKELAGNAARNCSDGTWLSVIKMAANVRSLLPQNPNSSTIRLITKLSIGSAGWVGNAFHQQVRDNNYHPRKWVPLDNDETKERSQPVRRTEVVADEHCQGNQAAAYAAAV